MTNRFKEKFLLYRIRAKNDPDAFGEIYDAYVAQIYRFIYFKVSSQQEAEDLTSETFLKAWQYLKLKGNREVSYLKALLYSTARSVVIDHYRSAAHRHRDVSLEDLANEAFSDPAQGTLQADIDRSLDAAKVLAALPRLKDEYREVIVMRYLDDLSSGEIAEALGKSPANVRVILHRATKALISLLHETNERQPQDNPQTGTT